MGRSRRQALGAFFDLRFSARNTRPPRCLARHKTELVELLNSGRHDTFARIPPGQTLLSRGSGDQLVVGADWHRDEQDPYVRLSRHTRAFCISGWRSIRRPCSMPRERLMPIWIVGATVMIRNQFGTRWRQWREVASQYVVLTSSSAAASELAEFLSRSPLPASVAPLLHNSGAEAVEAAIKLARARTVGILELVMAFMASRSRECRRPAGSSSSAASARRFRASITCRSGCSRRCKQR